MTAKDPMDELADRVAGRLAQRFAKNTSTSADDLVDTLTRAVGQRITDDTITAELNARVNGVSNVTTSTGIAPDSALNDPSLEARLIEYLNK